MWEPYPDSGLKHYDQFLSLQTAAAAAAVPLPLSDLAVSGYEHDSVFGDCSSGCSSYVDSPTSNYGAQSPTLLYPLINPNLEGIVDSSQQGVQQQNEWACASERSIFESMNRANPYSPQERKERIERYRSKRNLRNFNKKIKYECRKTLADNRRRVRGRFARNDEIEKASSQCHEYEEHVQEEEDDDYSWISILDALNKADHPLISSF